MPTDAYIQLYDVGQGPIHGVHHVLEKVAGRVFGTGLPLIHVFNHFFSDRDEERVIVFVQVEFFLVDGQEGVADQEEQVLKLFLDELEQKVELAAEGQPVNEGHNHFLGFFLHCLLGNGFAEKVCYQGHHTFHEVELWESVELFDLRLFVETPQHHLKN